MPDVGDDTAEAYPRARQLVRALVPRPLRGLVWRLRHGRAARYAKRFGIGGLLPCWALDRPPSHEPTRLHIPGLRMPVHLRRGTADTLVFEQVIVEEQYALDMRPAPTLVLDLGANIGLTSAYLANRWPRARIFAVEPHPENFALLARNVRGYPQVKAIHAAIWGRRGRLNLENPEGTTWGYRFTNVAGPCEVDALTIDDLIVDAGPREVILVKLDVEGAEREVMASSASWLPRVSALALEVHEDKAPGAQAALDAAVTLHGLRTRVHGETVIVTPVTATATDPQG